MQMKHSPGIFYELCKYVMCQSFVGIKIVTNRNYLDRHWYSNLAVSVSQEEDGGIIQVSTLSLSIYPI